MALREWQARADHEVVFLIAVTFGVVALLCLGTWGAKAMGLHGFSSALQHP